MGRGRKVTCCGLMEVFQTVASVYVDLIGK